MIYSKKKLIELCGYCVTISKSAGKIILQYFNDFDVNKDLKYKSDNSPVTAADIAAHDFITYGLSSLKLNNKPFNLPIISEESDYIINKPNLLRLDWSEFWLVDPLDGTKEFIANSPDFCINIALIKNNRPIIGVIHVPYIDLTYFAIAKHGAYKLDAGVELNLAPRIYVRSDHPGFEREFTNNKINIISSRRHSKINNINKTTKYSDFLLKLDKLSINYNLMQKGSALKFGLVADGTADLYPRFGLTSEWDTAAGDCIVHEAGGIVCDLLGNKLFYNKKESLINPEFFASSDKSLAKLF